MSTGFVGCLRKFRLRDSEIGKWSKNNRAGVIPCSKKVEPGYFFGTGGGHLHAFKRFRVGLDFDITMQIKPRNISGLLLAIQVCYFTGMQGRNVANFYYNMKDMLFSKCTA